MSDYILSAGKPGPPCIHDPACVGPIPCPLCVADIRLPESELGMVAGVSSAEHKRIHPFDVFALLQNPEVTDVFLRGREKVTVAVKGHERYSYWATVIEINGELYTQTTTVAPNTAEGIAMMLQFKATTPKMPEAVVSFSELEINKTPCGFQMSSPAPGTGDICCNREFGHTGDHGYTFQFTPAPEAQRLQRIQNDLSNEQVDRLDLQHRPPFIVEQSPRWGIVVALLVGMVFGAAVTALVLLTPTP